MKRKRKGAGAKLPYTLLRSLHFVVKLCWPMHNPSEQLLRALPKVIGVSLRTTMLLIRARGSRGTEAGRLFADNQSDLPSEFFDSEWYAMQYGIPMRSAQNHFQEFGSQNGLDPNPWFDTDWYQEQLKALGLEIDLKDCWAYFIANDYQLCIGPNPVFYFQTGLSQRHLLRPLTGLNLGVVFAYTKVRQAKYSRSPAIEKEKEEVRRIAVVIPTYDRWMWTERCLRALSHTEAFKLSDVYIVDDCSTTRPPQRLKDRYTNISWRRNETNLGFIGACNALLSNLPANTYEYVHLLNNDTEPQPGFLAESLRVLEGSPGVALVGSKLIYGDGTIQEEGGRVFRDGSTENIGRGDETRRIPSKQNRSVDYCSGASLLIRFGLFRSIGFFDSRYCPAYYEDTDLAFAVRQQGFDVIYCPKSVVVHHESKSYGSAEKIVVKSKLLLENRRRFREKWSKQLRNFPERGDT